MQRTIRRVIYLTLATGVLALLAGRVTATTSVGQVIGAGANLDGVAVPSGTTLLSPSTLQTTDRPVILHLSNGQALTVNRGTSAQLESVGSGEVLLTVDEGTVAVREPSGDVLTLAAKREVVFDAKGRVAEGARVSDEMVGVCRAAGDGDLQGCSLSEQAAAGCNWELVNVPRAEVEDYRAVAVVAGVGNNALYLDETCAQVQFQDPRATGGGSAGIAPAAQAGGTSGGGGGGGLSTVAKVGIGIGVTAATIVIIDELDDDDDEPASPTQP